MSSPVCTGANMKRIPCSRAHPLFSRLRNRICGGAATILFFSLAAGCTDPKAPGPDTSVTSVTVTPPSSNVLMGTNGQLTATVQTRSGTAASPVVSWSSSNTSVALVSGASTTATVLPVSPGNGHDHGQLGRQERNGRGDRDGSTGAANRDCDCQ